MIVTAIKLTHCFDKYFYLCTIFFFFSQTKQFPNLLFVLNVVAKVHVNLHVATCIDAAALTKKHILVAPVFFPRCSCFD